MEKTIILRTNEIIYFKRLKKTERNGLFTNYGRTKWVVHELWTNEMGRSRTMDERNEKAQLSQLASRHKHFKLQRTCFKLKLKR